MKIIVDTAKENLVKFNVPVVVCLNKYHTDTKEEIKLVSDFCNKLGVECEVSTAYTDGGTGALDLAKQVLSLCNKKSDFKSLYDVSGTE